MIVHVFLQNLKEGVLTHIKLDRPDITCLSDAAQRMPKVVFNLQYKLYGYHSMSANGSFTFREREVITL